MNALITDQWVDVPGRSVQPFPHLIGDGKEVR